MVGVAFFGTADEPMPPPEPPSQPRDWHASIAPDLRNHLVGKLAKAILPCMDPAVAHDQRFSELLAYARKVERDMFEAATDKETYYHMLAQKIYEIQKELQEKKNRRLNEAQQLAQQLQQLHLKSSSSSLLDQSAAAAVGSHHRHGWTQSNCNGAAQSALADPPKKRCNLQRCAILKNKILSIKNRKKCSK